MNIVTPNARGSATPAILLVDDEEDILPEYQEFLDLEGFQSLICSNPEQAVQLVLDWPSVSLVITDLRMAKLDGASLIRQLRSAVPAERHLEFIILTGDATSQISDDIANIPLIIKPADTDVLMAKIKSALARKGLNIRERLIPPDFRARDLWLALVLGAAGFLLNMLELQLGWGLHFMFGNALIFALIRVLSPQCFVLAVSISSLRSVLLWNHPWAWGIWTLEAGFIAYFAKRASPVRSDVLFWLLIGAPLIALSYGMVMNMDRLSMLLVIAKQATNGVLNVVIGEIGYLTTLGLKAPRKFADCPKMPIQSFLMTVLLATILLPTTAYLYIDAPDREQAARTSVDKALQERLQITSSTIDMWAHSRSIILSMFAENQLAVGIPAMTMTPDILAREFSEISIISKNGTALWTAGQSAVSRNALHRLAAHSIESGQSVRLASIAGQSATTDPQLLLIVSIIANGGPATIIAPVREGVLQRLLPDVDGKAANGTFLANSAAGIMPLSQTEPGIIQQVQSIPATLRKSALKTAIIVSDITYGNALMSDLRDARMAKAIVIARLPDWQVIAVDSLAPEVLEAREGQLQLFTALWSFVLLVTLIASLLSKRTEQSLRQLAQSAADLAVLGTRREKIDSLVISELNDISGRIASASSTVRQERGALVSYQRRLKSISQHAPIVIYALDVRDHKKGELVYVSEAIEKILGYTRNEVALAGWWSHAIHPEDYDRCIAVFSNLQSGRVVNAEYRLLHKLGHYVWVYDTLAIETNSTSGHFEAVGVLIDISERKAAAQRLLQADKMVSLGRMISGTAHELNQPLNFIKMATSNLREHARRGKMDTDHFISKLDTILSHVSRASAIIIQMRIFGRTPKEAPFPIDVKAVVDTVLTMIAPQLELDCTLVETSACPSDIKVRALPVQLEQVLLNLMLNANDAIRTRHNAGDGSDGWIKVSIARRDWLAVVTVADSGTGLSDEILPVIFEPFFTTKPPKDGTGLGLSISYGIIRDLGGTIRAENTKHGAQFIIELPLAE